VTIGIISVNKFLFPVVGTLDVGNPTPHSYLFLPPQKGWPDFFVKQMKYLIVEEVISVLNQPAQNIISPVLRLWVSPVGVPMEANDDHDNFDS